MKFTRFAFSLAFAGVVSAAAIPGVPGIPSSDGTVAGVEGAAAGTLAGLTQGAKRQFGLEAVNPVTESVGSSLNGVTGVTGSAVGTVESTIAGAAGTAEKAVADTLADTVPPVKRQLNAVEPVIEGVASSLNGGTGIIGSAVGTVESTAGGVAGTTEKAIADTIGGGLLHARQLGNLPATLEQTINFALIGLSGNPTGLYGALNNLRTIVSAGDITHEDLNNLPQAVQDVIAHLAVA